MTRGINIAFHEAAGKCWHAPALNFRGYCHKCGKTITKDKITGNIIRPNYADDPRLVIEVMREREDWPEFFRHMLSLPPYKANLYDKTRLMLSYFMDRTGKLANLGTEWLNQKGKE